MIQALLWFLFSLRENASEAIADFLTILCARPCRIYLPYSEQSHL